MNLLTVIIPTYEHENRLNDLVALIKTLSVASNNKYVEEILIVDNGNSLIANPDNLKFVTHNKVGVVGEPQIGLSYARNTGVINAKTNIIAFLDDDDEWLPKKIQKQVQFLEENTSFFEDT